MTFSFIDRAVPGGQLIRTVSLPSPAIAARYIRARAGVGAVASPTGDRSVAGRQGTFPDGTRRDPRIGAGDSQGHRTPH